MSLFVDIEKTLGRFHLQVRFETGEGVLALLGASGCGKSMTLKCIAGIERPDRGRIALDGVTLFDSEKRIDMSPQKRRVGYLFQQYALFPNMTVAQNVAAGVRGGRSAAARAVPEMLKAMGLEGLEGKRPHQLSGGQQQRLALARILVNGPQALLLDEPFSALDSHLRFQMEREVRQVLRSFAGTVLLVSHDRDEVFRLSERVAVMHEGRVETLGEKKSVFTDPATRNGALLTGCKNISRAKRLGERRLAALDWGLELDTAAPVGESIRYVGIRMHDLRPGGGENAFALRVTEELENPFSRTVLLRREDAPETLGWELDKALWDHLRAETVTVSLPPEALLLLKE